MIFNKFLDWPWFLFGPFVGWEMGFKAEVAMIGLEVNTITWLCICLFYILIFLQSLCKSVFDGCRCPAFSIRWRILCGVSRLGFICRHEFASNFKDSLRHHSNGFINNYIMQRLSMDINLNSIFFIFLWLVGMPDYLFKEFLLEDLFFSTFLDILWNIKLLSPNLVKIFILFSFHCCEV